jgi:hypothetical protein
MAASETGSAHSFDAPSACNRRRWPKQRRQRTPLRTRRCRTACGCEATTSPTMSWTMTPTTRDGRGPTPPTSSSNDGRGPTRPTSSSFDGREPIRRRSAPRVQPWDRATNQQRAQRRAEGGDPFDACIPCVVPHRVSQTSSGKRPLLQRATFASFTNRNRIFHAVVVNRHRVQLTPLCQAQSAPCTVLSVRRSSR